VVEQLRSGGVIEALQVQRAGFPCRRGGVWGGCYMLLGQNKSQTLAGRQFPSH
jgi:myosin heavy subunit